MLIDLCLQHYNSSKPLLIGHTNVRKKKGSNFCTWQKYMGTLIGKYYLPFFTGSLDQPTKDT